MSISPAALSIVSGTNTTCVWIIAESHMEPYPAHMGALRMQAQVTRSAGAMYLAKQLRFGLGMLVTNDVSGVTDPFYRYLRAPGVIVNVLHGRRFYIQEHLSYYHAMQQ